jgi:hypothetical protein
MIVILENSITFTPLVWKLWNNKCAYCLVLLRAFWWHQKHREARTVGKGYGDEHYHKHHLDLANYTKQQVVSFWKCKLQVKFQMFWESWLYIRTDFLRTVFTRTWRSTLITHGCLVQDLIPVQHGFKLQTSFPIFLVSKKSCSQIHVIGGISRSYSTC